jgi:hypothetical protein
MELPRGAAGGGSTRDSGPSTPTVNTSGYYMVWIITEAHAVINETHRSTSEPSAGCTTLRPAGLTLWCGV